MNLNGAAAIVTGGASGLGAATAEQLTQAGAKVSIFDLNAEVGTETAKRLGGSFHKVNVTDDLSVTDGVAAAEAEHGVARILINCAGVAPAIRVVARDGTAHSLDAFRKAVEINLIGSFNVISKFAARLIAAKIDGKRRE